MINIPSNVRWPLENVQPNGPPNGLTLKYKKNIISNNNNNKVRERKVWVLAVDHTENGDWRSPLWEKVRWPHTTTRSFDTLLDNTIALLGPPCSPVQRKKAFPTGGNFRRVGPSALFLCCPFPYSFVYMFILISLSIIIA